MTPPERTTVDRQQSFKEWSIFFRNGMIVAFLTALVLFWDSPHSAEEITVAIAVPLIIFNLMPFVLHAVSAQLPQPPQRNLPLPAVEPKAIPSDRRRNALILIAMTVVMIILLFGGVAIFFASFTYGYLGIPWAVGPARHLSFVLVGFSLLPVLTVASFLAGMVWTGKIRDSALALWIYLEALRPLSHWPTFA